MWVVRVRRRVIVGLRRVARREATATAPPVFWGRVGAYEAVTREGMLLLLAPDAVHPSRRVANGA